MFRGLHEHTIDQKGRVSVPAHLREVLTNVTSDQRAVRAHHGDRLVVTTGIERCLVAYPLSTWKTFEARLAELSQFDPALVQLRRIYVAGATDCELDRHGRLLIPPMLREYAGLSRDVVWAGMGTTIELWAKEQWTEQASVSRQDRQAIVKALAGLGL